MDIFSRIKLYGNDIKSTKTFYLLKSKQILYFQSFGRNVTNKIINAGYNRIFCIYKFVLYFHTLLEYVFEY